jgi:hypothetical protein
MVLTRLLLDRQDQRDRQGLKGLLEMMVLTAQ